MLNIPTKTKQLYLIYRYSYLSGTK